VRIAASVTLALAVLAWIAGPARAGTVSRSGDVLVFSETTALDETNSREAILPKR
jgi:hypothetical protein